MLILVALAMTFLAVAHHAEASEASSLCPGDAVRLCFDEISDRERIAAWLRRRTEELSPGCRTMFTTPEASPAAQNAGK